MRDTPNHLGFLFNRQAVLATAAFRLHEEGQTAVHASQHAVLGGMYHYFQELIKASHLTEDDLRKWGERFASVELLDYPTTTDGMRAFKDAWSKRGISVSFAPVNTDDGQTRYAGVSPMPQTSYDGKTRFQEGEQIPAPDRPVATWAEVARHTPKKD